MAILKQIRYGMAVWNKLDTLCCVKCNKVKDKNNFSFYGKHRAPAAHCYDCHKESLRDRYNTDKDYRNKIRTRHNNNPKRGEYTTKYHRERYHRDPFFKLSKNIRTRITHFISKDKKLGSTRELLGCSGDQLKNHLGKQFKNGMTWDNYGSVWHIDHIIPVANFDLSNKKSQMECFNYNNLQPLFATTEIAIQHGHINEIGNLNKQDKLI